MAEDYIKDEKTGRFVPTGKAVMAEKPITIRLPADIDNAIRCMADRNEFLREVIASAVKSRIEKSTSA